jgi:hypothetical protein
MEWEAKRRGLVPGWPFDVPSERFAAPWYGVTGSGLLSRALGDEEQMREAADRGEVLVWGRVRQSI